MTPTRKRAKRGGAAPAHPETEFTDEMLRLPIPLKQYFAKVGAAAGIPTDHVYRAFLASFFISAGIIGPPPLRKASLHDEDPLQ